MAIAGAAGDRVVARRDEIVLIGPMNVGKTTVGRLLADRRMIELMLAHHSHRALATRTVFTEERSPGEVADLIHSELAIDLERARLTGIPGNAAQ